MRNENTSVFNDLGFSPEEAADLKMRADLHSRIVRCAQNYSQAQLQQLLGEPQSRISDLMRGKISRFSLGKLVQYAEALQMRPEIKTQEPIAVLSAAH